MDLKPNPKETVYFVVKVIMTFVVLLICGFSIAAMSQGTLAIATITVFIIYAFFIFLFFVIQKIVMIGILKGNGIKVNEKQFPEVFLEIKNIADKLQMKSVPPVYIIQNGGILNAFATRFCMKDYVAVYSDVFTMLHKDIGVLKFVIAHEFTHVKRNHMSKRFWTIPSAIIPFLSPAYSRACEYTADKYGKYACENGAENGLLFLAAGKDLYGQVSADNYIETTNSDRTFVVKFVEKLLSHPMLPKRIQALKIPFHK